MTWSNAQKRPRRRLPAPQEAVGTTRTGEGMLVKGERGWYEQYPVAPSSGARDLKVPRGPWDDEADRGGRRSRRGGRDPWVSDPR